MRIFSSDGSGKADPVVIGNQHCIDKNKNTILQAVMGFFLQSGAESVMIIQKRLTEPDTAGGSMKIRFLGTSFGAPSPGRHQQSILLETENGDIYLVDTGAPVLDILVNEGYDLTRIRAVFITHLHGDHMSGLIDILNLAAYFRIRCDVYLPEQRGIEAFESFSEMMTSVRNVPGITYRLIGEGDFYDDGNLQVKSVQTDHMTKPCYGFLLCADQAKVYITGDLHPSLRDFPSFLYEEATDMIVTECAHFTPEELYAKLRQCSTKTAAVIHVMPEGKYAGLMEGAADMPMSVVFPADGDNYSF